MNPSSILAGLFTFVFALTLNSPQPIEYHQLQKPCYLVATVGRPQRQVVARERKPKPTRDQLLQKYFGKSWQTAKRVMLAESGGNPKATNYNHNGTIDRGLFQINSVHLGRVSSANDLFVEEINVRVARDIWQEQGWCPWYGARKIGIATNC